MSTDNPFITRKTTDWALCCLCQKESEKDLRCPYKRECHLTAYDTLETDLKNFIENDVRLPLGVTMVCLNDGTGIANTLRKNEAKYHNGCRSLFRSYMVERKLKKRETQESTEAVISPKKTRLNFNATLDRKNPQCVWCEKYEVDSTEQLYRARSANCGKNLLKWATESKNRMVFDD